MWRMLFWETVLLLISMSCLSYIHAYSETVETQIIGDTVGHRMIRSAALVGKKALKWVLKGAKFIYSNGFDNVFVKKGGLRKALDDFDRINTDDKITYEEKALIVKRKVKGQKFGKVGDRILVLNNDSRTGAVTLSVSKFPQDTGHPDTILSKIIIYLK